MDTNKFQEIYHRFTCLVETKELKKAINTLLELLQLYPDAQLQQQTEECNTNYRYLLQYAITGNEDSQREEILAMIRTKLSNIGKKLNRAFMIQYDPSIYYEKIRTLSVEFQKESWQTCMELYRQKSNYHTLLTQPDDEATKHALEWLKECEKRAGSLFYRTWLSDTIDFASLKEAIAQGDLQIAELLVSALFLRLLNEYNAKELLCFIDLYDLRTDALRWKILSDLIILFYCYESHILSSPMLKGRINIWSTQPGISQAVQTAILQFIRSFETEAITQKLNNEILPEMMKLGPKLGTRVNLNELINDPTLNERNPEWAETWKESGLTDKLKEVNELQQEGADVMMSTFSTLKQDPFFKDISNWFLPFIPTHSLFTPLTKDDPKNTFLSLLSQSSFICDSDKYSFCFSILSMPSMYREKVLDSFRANHEQMIELEKAGRVANPLQEEMQATIKKHVQNLYRFYKLHPRRKDFINIFDYALQLHRSTLLTQLMDSNASKLFVAFYLKKGRYKEALELLERESNREEEAERYQQIGYCYQMIGEWGKALNAYLHADLLVNNNFWTIKRIAEAYRQLKAYDKALLYYEKIAELKPDNIANELNKGACYLELKEYDKALKCYFKADFLDTKSRRAWRPIAWCCFLVKKLENAQRYYQKILEDSPTTQDYLNAGHVEWCKGNRKMALAFYKKGIDQNEEGYESFISLIKNDRTDLINNGVKEEEIALLCDYLRYEAEA